MSLGFFCCNFSWVFFFFLLFTFEKGGKWRNSRRNFWWHSRQMDFLFFAPSFLILKKSKYMKNRTTYLRESTSLPRLHFHRFSFECVCFSFAFHKSAGEEFRSSILNKQHVMLENLSRAWAASDETSRLDRVAFDNNRCPWEATKTCTISFVSNTPCLFHLLCCSLIKKQMITRWSFLFYFQFYFKFMESFVTLQFNLFDYKWF